MSDDLAEAGTRVPDYYAVIRPSHLDKPFDVMDVCDYLWPDEHNYNRKDVLKYLVRAGRKPGQSEVKDWTKLLRCAARELRRLGGKVPGDL